MHDATVRKTVHSESCQTPDCRQNWKYEAKMTKSMSHIRIAATLVAGLLLMSAATDAFAKSGGSGGAPSPAAGNGAGHAFGLSAGGNKPPAPPTAAPAPPPVRPAPAPQPRH
jgi:hypothetical protein